MSSKNGLKGFSANFLPHSQIFMLIRYKNGSVHSPFIPMVWPTTCLCMFLLKRTKEAVLKKIEYCFQIFLLMNFLKKSTAYINVTTTVSLKSSCFNINLRKNVNISELFQIKMAQKSLYRHSIVKKRNKQFRRHQSDRFINFIEH